MPSPHPTHKTPSSQMGAVSGGGGRQFCTDGLSAGKPARRPEPGRTSSGTPWGFCRRRALPPASSRDRSPSGLATAQTLALPSQGPEGGSWGASCLPATRSLDTSLVPMNVLRMAGLPSPASWGCFGKYTGGNPLPGPSGLSSNPACAVQHLDGPHLLQEPGRLLALRQAATSFVPFLRREGRPSTSQRRGGSLTAAQWEQLLQGRSVRWGPGPRGHAGFPGWCHPRREEEGDCCGWPRDSPPLSSDHDTHIFLWAKHLPSTSGPSPLTPGTTSLHVASQHLLSPAGGSRQRWFPQGQPPRYASTPKSDGVCLLQKIKLFNSGIPNWRVFV